MTAPSTSPLSETSAKAPRWPLVFVPLALAFVIGIFTVPQSELIGLLGIGLMLTLMAAKAPVAISMIIPSLLGILAIIGWPATERMLENLAFESSADWSLSVIPMFVLMGLLLWRSGVTNQVYDAMNVLARHVPGRLAVVTNLSGGVLAAVSGSTVATSYALGRVGIPEMLRNGYDPRLATSSVLMAGTGGQLMPPSLLSVIYAGVAGTSIGPQLLAGVAPAIVLVSSYTLAIVAIATFWPHMAGENRERPPAPGLRGGLRLVLSIWPVPLLILLVLGGIYSGVLTATEAGAAGAIIALGITLWKKRGQGAVAAVREAVGGAVRSTAAIMLLLIGAIFFTELLRFSELADALAESVANAGFNRIQLLLVIMVLFIFLGMFMSTLAVIIISVPILMPVLAALDISLLWFGAFAVLLAELGMVTPPVGVLTYIVHGVANEPEVSGDRSIPLKDLFVGVSWMVPATVLVLVVMILFPELVVWLPNRGAS